MDNKTYRVRKKILIVEDNEINQEILASILEDEYDLLYAENGKIGLEMLSEYYQELSLVMLDVYMPICTGFEFLESIKDNPVLSTIPVIVTTGSDKREDEIKCLTLGASDFVTKPYNPEIVLARVHSIIKLKESVSTLSIVEYDDLTGVYTMQAFYHHAQERLTYAKENESFDLTVSDLKDFKLINSIFGYKKGNEILSYIGNVIKNIMPDAIVARQGDKFFALYESSHRFNTDESQFILANATNNLDFPSLNMKYGLYKDVDKKVPISNLCDRVVMAVNTIKNNSLQFYVEYDESLEKELIEKQNFELQFDKAIKNEEFKVWFQPKVDPFSYKIVGAEALIRWQKEDGSFWQPDKFIPLFEKNGQIGRLDQYMFKHVCIFLKERIEQGLPVVPVSVNLSRNSIFQNDVANIYSSIACETGIDTKMIPLELTESATLENELIPIIIDNLIRKGFSLHIDDFGTGYSSLSSLTSLPFDVVKLDKQLIDYIGDKKGDILVQHLIEMARDIGLDVVAEGVENNEQLEFLKSVGCNIVQGYYFSPPVDQEKFEDFLNTDYCFK